VTAAGVGELDVAEPLGGQDDAGTKPLAAQIGPIAQAEKSAGAIHLQNAGRTGYTDQELMPPFRRVWTYRARNGRL